MMNRRDVLNLALAAGPAAIMASTAESADDDETAFPVIDTNVSLFSWPFRQLPLDRIELLVKKLRTLGIAEAWAGSFEGILHRDIAAVNARLAEACQTHRELVPVGSVNLELPGWEEDLRRCLNVHKMPGVRLHPNYHGYALDDSRFVHLLRLATTARRFVQIAVAMEDTRTQHPSLQVADVDLTPLPSQLSAVPGARVQILNHRLRNPLLQRLAAVPGVFFDTARVDGTDSVPQLVQQVPAGRVMFGSHAPLLIPEAALIRVHESGVLEAAALQATLFANAKRFLS